MALKNPSSLLFIALTAIISKSSLAYELTLADHICDQIIEHVPDADVAYSAEINASLNSVDLNPSPLNEIGKTDDPIDVEIDIDLNEFRTIGLLSPSNADVNIKPNIDLYLTYKNGKLYYKDRPLSTANQFEVREKCLSLNKAD